MANPSRREKENRGPKIENQTVPTDPRSSLQTSSDPRSMILEPRRSIIPFPRLIAALASAGLLWACFFPLACGWLAWVALVPLLCLVRSEAPARKIYWSAFAGGLAFFWPVLQWLRVGDYNMMYYSWGALATYCAVYFPLAIFLSRQIDRRTLLPLVLVFPAVWTALEFFRSYLLTGFPWYYLAHSQQDFLSVIQISDLAGAYAVSFLVAAVNVVIFEWLYQARWFRALFGLVEPVLAPVRWRLLTQTAVVGLMAAATLIYGRFRLGQDSFDTGPRVALIQGNLDQDVRNDASESDQMAQQAFDHVRRLCDQAALQHPPPQLIVWPENSCPQEWRERPSGRPTPKSLEFADWAAERWRTNILIGLECYSADANGKELRYNSAVLVLAHDDTGKYRGQPSGRYDKMHRVPFGEYVPFQESFPWMKTFAPYDFEYSIRSGKEFTRFDMNSYRFGVLICFEATDPLLARQYVGSEENKSNIDFFVNISNDGWWRGTSGHDQHLAISRFRAIENRRAVCRSVNMGISAVIDGNGRVLAPRTIKSVDNIQIWEISAGQETPMELPVSRWYEFKQVQGVLLASVPIDHRASLYARWGDWFAWGCWMVVGAGLAWSLADRLVRKKGTRMA
jgi:apolipoprotein N-acyltransferase